MRQLFTLFICFLITFHVHSQTEKWINFSKSTNTTCILDDDNFLWIGSQAGLTKYDKTTGQSQLYNASNSGLPENSVVAIAKDSQGDIWISTMFEGVVKFDRNNTWESVETVNNNLSENYINGICIDDNNTKWMSSFSGLFKMDSLGLTIFNESNSGLPSNSLHCVIIDNYGNLWLGASGLIKYNGNEWEMFTAQDTSLPLGSFYTIEHGNNNDLWCTCGPHLVKIDSTGFNTYTSPNLENNFFSVAVDQNDSVFMGIWDGEYAYQKFYNGSWYFYNCNKPGITNCNVWQVEVDNEGNKWFIGDAGVDEFSSNNTWDFNNLSNSPLPENYITSIAIGNNGLNYFRSNTGVIGYNWNNWTAEIETDRCDQICFDNFDNLLLASPKKVYVYNGSEMDTLITPFVGSPINSVRSITTDMSNHIWMTYPNDYYNFMKGGVFMYNGTNWITYNESNSGLPSSFVSDIAIDGFNNVWFATSNGVAKFSNGQWTVFNKDNSSLPDNSIFSVTVDSVNNIWVSLPYEVLATFDGVNWTVYESPVYPIISSLSELAIDSKGNIWGVGLNKIAKFDLINWEYFNCDNSPLPHNNTKTLAIDQNDNVFVGTSINGLYIFNENGINPVLTGIIEYSKAKACSIYPNPTSGKINIESVSDFSNQPIYIRVYNTSGVIVYSAHLSGQHQHIVDLNNNKKGVYIVQIETNKAIVTEKVIIQ